MTLHLVFAALMFAALPASGQSLSEVIAQATDIPVEEWRAMASGRTLTYRIDGELWAMERYEPGSDRVALEFRDGSCLEGRWDYAAPFYCFHWENEGASCFRHLRLGDEILVVPMADGEAAGTVQAMTGISDTPLACGPALTS